MARPISFQVDPQDLPYLEKLRYEHPHPRVQQRCWVLWLVAKGMALGTAAELAGVSRITAWRYGEDDREGGLDGLIAERWEGQPGELAEHADTLAETFRKEPPRTVTEAAERIAEATGVQRRETQVRKFLRHHLGLKWRRTASVPCPPKKKSRSMSAPRPSS